MWNIVGEKEKAEVTRFRSSFGLKGRAKRNKKGRMLEVKEQILRRDRKHKGAEMNDLFFMD